MTAPPTPEETAQRLQAADQDEAAALIRSMAAELEAMRQERDSLADFTRSVAIASGGLVESRLAVRARRSLDTLRVTERCPKRESGRHRWMRPDPVFGSRCFSCDARRPEPVRNVCWCGHQQQLGEDHRMCSPAMD